MSYTDKTVRGSRSIRSGRKSLVFFSFTALAFVAIAVFLIWPGIADQGKVSARVQSNGLSRDMFNQVVRLGDGAGYGVYAEKGINAAGENIFRGTVGVGAGSDLKGVDQSLRGRSDIDLAAVRGDLSRAFSALRQLPCTTIDDGVLSGKTFGTGSYCVPGTKIEGDLVFDAQGDENALLVLRVDGTFEAAAGSRIRLVNGARAFNVYIVVDGNALIGPGVEIGGGLFAKNNIEVGEGSRINGRTISIGGTVTTRGAELGAGTGQMEICKAITGSTTLPSTNLYTFTFAAVGGGTQSVTIPAGVCSAPREVPSGSLTVTESYNGTFAIANATATRVGNVPVTGVTFSSPAGTVTVPILEGDLDNETTLTVTNQAIRGGFVEICKFPSIVTSPVIDSSAEQGSGEESGDDPVTGVFEFRFVAFPGGTTQSVFVPVGGCSLPLQITSFTPAPTTPTFVSRITEVGRAGVLLESVSTDPTGSLVGTGGGIGTIGAGGYADVTVTVGNAGSQVIVSFFNRTAPGEVKVCKVAGPGIPVNTIFTFDVSGTIPGGTATTPTFPGTLGTFTVAVPAGPGPEGYCRYVRNAADTANRTFVVGRRVAVVERTLAVSGAPAVVSRIDELNAGDPIVEDLGPGGRVSFVIRAGTGVATFTNIRYLPGSLKICKIGTGTAAGRTFTFDMLPAANPFPFFEDDFDFGSVSVPAGSCSPPITGFPTDLNILVDERAVAGVATTAITAQPGAGTIVSTNLPLGQGTIDLATGVTTNEIIFTNGTAPTPPGLRSTEFDFDGDGKADPSIYRPSNGQWWVLGSSSGTTSAAFGISSDVIVPADYDGDGKTDYAVYRNGQWHILGSTGGYMSNLFGTSGDIPQPGDYDGDGKADLAVYRPSNGTWYMLRSRDGFGAVNFGIATDRPVAADFDGDGKYDPAVYRGGTWYILGSTAGFSGYAFGIASDRPVPADYDGDGKADAAVYRDGVWYLLRSTAGFAAESFGTADDKPVPADYDGDAKADIAVFRPSDGVWYLMRSSGADSNRSFMSIAFGTATDTPIPY